MSHLMLHPVHDVPVRPTVMLSLAVVVANIALIWTAFGLQSEPADDSTQIRAVVQHQIEALNERDAGALQLTYCSEQGVIGDLIVGALGPRTHDRVLVARTTDIHLIGSSLATARVELAVTGGGLPSLEPRPDAVSVFRNGETGWKMCDPGNGPSGVLSA